MIENVAAFAFAYDPIINPLPKLYEEMMNMTRHFGSTQLHPLPIWQVRLEDLEMNFSKYGDSMRILHYAGHSGKKRWVLHQSISRQHVAFTQGLAKNIGDFCKHLNLVFLNGCSTQDQVDFFLQNGAKCVIATNLPVKDLVAFQFANAFYRFFIPLNNPLHNAFNAALNHIETDLGQWVDNKGLWNTEMVEEQPVRDADFDEPVPVNMPLYEIHYHPDHEYIRHQRIQDWYTQKKQSAPQTTELSNKGIDISAYLLCDRVNEAELIRTVLEEKVNGNIPEPFFFFIHELEEDRPELLADRAERFETPSFAKDTAVLEALNLPKIKDFEYSDVETARQTAGAKYKTRLLELYINKFENTAFQRPATLTRRPEEELLLIAHHEVLADELMGAEGGNNEANRERLEEIFRYYIEDFSDYLQREFSTRLVVMCTIRYFRKPKPVLVNMFKSMEERYSPSRFKNIGVLNEVTPMDVDTWRKEIDQKFRDKKNPIRFNVNLNEVFPEDKDSLPFDEIIEKLVQQINQYNKKFTL